MASEDEVVNINWRTQVSFDKGAKITLRLQTADIHFHCPAWSTARNHNTMKKIQIPFSAEDLRSDCQHANPVHSRPRLLREDNPERSSQSKLERFVKQQWETGRRGRSPHFISTLRAWSPTFQTKVTPLQPTYQISEVSTHYEHIWKGVKNVETEVVLG